MVVHGHAEDQAFLIEIEYIVLAGDGVSRSGELVAGQYVLPVCVSKAFPSSCL